MEIHQLRYAVEVHARGSFTAAAEALRVSQPGVSAQVAKLERELDVRLFERGPRAATPTPDGATLLPLMATALDDVARIEQTADELRGLVRGSLRIGTVIGCAIPGYLRAFADFRAAHPAVAVTVGEADSTDLIDQLASGEIDIALLAHAASLPEQFDATTFVDEPIAAGVPMGHPWARRPSVSVADLADQSVLTLAEGTGIRAALRRTGDLGGVVVEPAVEAHSPDTVLALAARGAGIAVLSASMLSEPLATVAIDGAEHARLSIASRRRPGVAVRAFLGLLRARLLDETAV